MAKILYLIRENNQFGFINENGDVVIEPQFQNDLYFNHYKDAVDFTDSVPIKKDNMWGYINERGDYVIPPKFDVAFSFSDSRAAVGIFYRPHHRIDNFLFGYINGKGEIVIDYQYNSHNYFFNDYAFAIKPTSDVQKGSFGSGIGLFIDKTGNIVMEVSFYVYPFNEEGYAIIHSEKGYGIIDKTLSIIIEPKYESAYYQNGLFRVMQNNHLIAMDSNFQIIAKEKAIDKYIYQCNLIFSNGIAPTLKDDKLGFINANGDLVIAHQFDEVLSFTEGFCAVKLKKHWGYINQSGDMVIDPQFTEAESFCNGIAMVQAKVKIHEEKGGMIKTKRINRIGFIDTKGQWIGEPKYFKTGYHMNFINNLALVKYDKKHLAYINRKGVYVWKEKSY